MEVRKMNKKSQGFGKTTSGASVQSAGFGTEFASETNAQEVRQQNAQAEAKKSQASSANAQSAGASYGTEFATETNVQAVKQQNAKSAAKKS
ncbi:gamma-type small acid-soluble spore protein [Bacillus cereus]|uniref:gamma-type small acid-soluble spore protein n=1 Tax=Bacillus TaxID=1386 RepID=UPI0015A51A9B|nr:MULTISPECIES: gamma-type small acid-soluble spore protein [unclassified Bacillus (in: firmicutes)]